MKTDTTDVCVICGRECGGIMQYHHLKPKTFSTRNKEIHTSDNKIYIHKICHQKIHATYSEQELYHTYHTPDLICDNPEMIKFIKWITKKPLDFYDKNDDTKRRKRKRKR